MVFNSLEFLAFFLVVTPVFFWLRGPWRAGFLLLASCGFYAAAYPAYLLVLFGLIAIDYSAGRLLERAKQNRRVLLAASLLANLSVLFIFKYFNFFTETVIDLAAAMGVTLAAPKLSWILPVGLSFHTFQSMAYVIEVYRRSVPAERSLSRFATYVLFYPQLVAGPIERPGRFLPQLNRNSAGPDGARIVSGIQLVIWGMFKKVVVADRTAETVDFVFGEVAKSLAADPSALPMNSATLWIAALSFTVQIYCDFSGYSDMARGIARMMGYDLMLNFDFPYFSRSVAEFWRRWHISLSSWFRDYVYIPLGGSKVSGGRVMVNVLVVFLLSGLWHGANWTFVAWGAVHGGWVALERLWGGRVPKRLPGVLQLMMTGVVVVLAWVVFRAATLHEAIAYLGGMTRLGDFGHGLGAIIATGKGKAAQFVGVSRFELLITWAFVALLFAVEWVQLRQGVSRVARLAASSLDRPVLRWVALNCVIIATLIFGQFAGRQFIYFQF